MNQIRPWLTVGKYRETKHLSLLKAHKIDAMLQLAELVEQPDIVTLYLDVDDGAPLPEEMLRRGIGFIKEHEANGNNVLVACGAGISRAASFAIASLSEVEDITLLEAYREVKHHRPETMPHPALWKSLCTYYNEDVPFLELMRK